MTTSESRLRDAEHQSATFVVAATSEAFNDRMTALHGALVDNFGEASVHLTREAHAGLLFAHAVPRQEGEPHYALESRIQLARPLALNAMKQIVQNGLDIQLGNPDVVGSSIIVPVSNPTHVDGMRRLFGTIARTPEIEQPTTDAIEPITLNSALSPEYLDQIGRFMKQGLLLQPIKAPFRSLQLWEAGNGSKSPAKIVDEIAIKVE